MIIVFNSIYLRSPNPAHELINIYEYYFKTRTGDLIELRHPKTVNNHIGLRKNIMDTRGCQEMIM